MNHIDQVAAMIGWGIVLLIACRVIRLGYVPSLWERQCNQIIERLPAPGPQLAALLEPLAQQLQRRLGRRYRCELTGCGQDRWVVLVSLRYPVDCWVGTLAVVEDQLRVYTEPTQAMIELTDPECLEQVARIFRAQRIL